MARALSVQLEEKQASTKSKAAAPSKNAKRRFIRVDGSDSDDAFDPQKHDEATPPCKKAKRRHVQSADVRTRAAAARDVGLLLGIGIMSKYGQCLFQLLKYWVFERLKAFGFA